MFPILFHRVWPHSSNWKLLLAIDFNMLEEVMELDYRERFLSKWVASLPLVSPGDVNKLLTICLANERIMGKKMNYIAIDFETANKKIVHAQLVLWL
ncbi:hypothetical protein DP68_13160 [Clostridium sp. HMP27]|nr:hypothetical protein DP68_13160 [Clostridium sp. HMP27]